MSSVFAAASCRLLLLLWIGIAAAQNGIDLDSCEQSGLAAGAAAARGACAALTLQCPAPDFELRSSFPNSLPEVLFTEVLRGTCTLIFQTSCKIAAVGAIFNSPDFLDCQNILSYGPSQDAPDTCPDQSSALQIFSGYADSICEQEVDEEEFRPTIQVAQPSAKPPPKEKEIKDEVVSLGRPTFQSTTAYGLDSSLAVDAKPTTTCTHTGYSYKKSDERTRNPWWSVDLGATRKITRIKITGRQDCCWDRLTNFEIRVGDSRPLGDGSSDPPTQNRICESGLSIEDAEPVEVPCSLSGRYVTIRIPGNYKVLTLCDVKVYAEVEENIVITNDVVLSKGKPTYQSSTLWNGFSGRAVDGNKNGVFDSKSCTHTGTSPNVQRSSNPWWAIDLGSSRRLSGIRITARSDCCADWLDNFEIRVGDRMPNGSGWQNPLCRSRLKIPQGETYQFDCSATGRYVTIRIPRSSAILNLCEVEVLG